MNHEQSQVILSQAQEKASVSAHLEVEGISFRFPHFTLEAISFGAQSGELVAIIGRPARRVTADNALDYVGGYTVACDYAIREYLENYYRPNLAVKNRDATTPLGPWVIDASDIGDPQNLHLRATVNGEVVQDGSTADMILDVASLIAYLSETMTLMPGDMILTGTPQGVHFCAAGDEVVCEIEGVGRLVNRLVAEIGS